MIRLFDSLRSFLGDHGEWGTVVNDSLMSRAHSKLTFYGLLAASCLLSASTYYGDAIKCTTMGGYDGGFFETHCILGGTWHMPKYASSEFTNRVITPGIGPKVETIPVRQTCYYYWLPLLVLLSAFSFKAPKILWDLLENNFVFDACGGMDMRRAPIDCNITYLTILRLRHFLFDHSEGRFFYRAYLIKFLVCEFLYIANAVLQWAALSYFLDGGFENYGHNYVKYVLTGSATDVGGINPADFTFPKKVGCTIKTYGTAGETQEVHGLCILTLNIINEKVFAIIWIWLVLLIWGSSVHLATTMLTLAVPETRNIRGLHENPAHRAIYLWMVPSHYHVLMLFRRNVHADSFHALVKELARSRGLNAEERRSLVQRRLLVVDHPNQYHQ